MTNTETIVEALEHYNHYNKLMLSVAITDGNPETIARFSDNCRRASIALQQIEEELSLQATTATE
jgi:hypothetical protein